MKRQAKIKTPFAAALNRLLTIGSTTQEDVAQAVGYANQKSVSALITERTAGSEDKRRAIAKYFGFSLDDFLELGDRILKDEVSYLEMATIVARALKRENNEPLDLPPEITQKCASCFNLQEPEKVIPSDPSPNILDGNIAAYGDCSKCLSLQDEATKRHQIVIEGFQDRELAIKFNEALVEIESLEPSDFQELYENALTKLRKLREKKGIVPQQEKKTVNQ